MKEFDLIGDIGTDITDKSVSAMLQEANGEDVTFYIASLGGLLSVGQTIYNLIKKYSGKTTGVIIGSTASAGTIAIEGCDKVVCNNNAPFLIHNSSNPEGGNAKELKVRAAELEKFDKIMLSIYKNKTGLPEATISELMDRSDWLMPEDALKYGFVDEIIEPKIKAVAYASASLNTDLLTKLQTKMKIFGSKDKKDVVATSILDLKDGKQLLINASALAKDVEVMAIGAAASLPDGEYELKDGRKIKCEGGMITEVTEVPAPNANEPLSVDAVVAAIVPVIAEQISKVEANFKAELAKISSQHTPNKGKGPQASAEKVDVHAKVDEITLKIREGIENARKS